MFAVQKWVCGLKLRLVLFLAKICQMELFPWIFLHFWTVVVEKKTKNQNKMNRNLWFNMWKSPSFKIKSFQETKGQGQQTKCWNIRSTFLFSPTTKSIQVWGALLRIISLLSLPLKGDPVSFLACITLRFIRVHFLLPLWPWSKNFLHRSRGNSSLSQMKPKLKMRIFSYAPATLL